MGCGCGGAKKATVTSLSGSTATVDQSGPITYDVFDTEGVLVASSSNVTLARVEARRTGGTVVPRRSTAVSQ